MYGIRQNMRQLLVIVRLEHLEPKFCCNDSFDSRKPKLVSMYEHLILRRKSESSRNEKNNDFSQTQNAFPQNNTVGGGDHAPKKYVFISTWATWDLGELMSPLLKSHCNAHFLRFSFKGLCHGRCLNVYFVPILPTIGVGTSMIDAVFWKKVSSAPICLRGELFFSRESSSSISDTGTGTCWWKKSG